MAGATPPGAVSYTHLDVYRRQLLNSDYEAKRFQSMALNRLQLTVLPKGTFRKWIQKKGKSGSQAKVPRLSNERTYLEEVLAMISHPLTQQKTV